jgi:hypothetical protein
MDPLFQCERFASGLRVAERFRELGERYGKTPAQMVIAWVLAQPGILCALTGPSTLPHLEENLGASGWTIASTDLQDLKKFFQIEDLRLGQEQKQSVHLILSQDLDREGAFADLLSVIETLVETGWAAEGQVMPDSLPKMQDCFPHFRPGSPQPSAEQNTFMFTHLFIPDAVPVGDAAGKFAILEVRKSDAGFFTEYDDRLRGGIPVAAQSV